MSKSKKVTQINRLTGNKLLARVKALHNLNRTEKAKACGYLTQLPSGQERAQIAEFVEALLDAQGINLNAQSVDKPGRRPTYRISVHKNGTLLIGSAYTQEMNLNPGDRFEIQLGRKIIKLIAVDDDQFDADELDDDEIDS